MIPVLLRAGARYHLRHRLQLALALLGVTLGVAVVVAVDVATGSARRAFDLSAETVSGRATHEIVAGPGGIPDSVYALLRRTAPPGVAAAPVIDRFVRLPGRDGRVIRLLGVDPFAERPFRTFLGGPAGGTDIGALVTGRAIALSAGTATALGIAPRDSLSLAFGPWSTTVTVAALLDPGDDLSRRALTDVALADISTAQELTGTIGVIDRIDLRIEPDAGSAAADSLSALLPAGMRLLAAGTRADATARLTRAFDTNLTALALVALVFGIFLIYNSVSFSVVQRRPLFGLLRAQGVTARELFAQVMAEAAVLGAIATLLGLAAGTALGSQLVKLVARTINDLYFAVTVSTLRIETVTVLKAVLLGIGATLTAAVVPAFEALATPPRATLARVSLERRTLRSAPRLALAGLVCAVAAALMLVVPSRSITLAFAALFVLILACALLTPMATVMLMAGLRPLTSRLGAVARMAGRGVTGSLSRTAPAIAALGVALSVGIAVTLMIASFRAGVVTWLGRSLQADLYVAAPDVGANRSDVVLDTALMRGVAGIPGVAGISTYRQVPLLADSDLVRLIAFDPFPRHRLAFEMLDVDADRAWRAFDRGAILVSEPLAYRRSIGAGDTIVLPTDRGLAPFAVAAIYRDYASEHGVIFMPRAAYEAAWRDRGITSLALFLEEGADPDAVGAAVRMLPAARGVVMRPTAALRTATLTVFDRTFLITGVLRLLALIVAFVGVTGALMALQLERAREIGVLRATGLTPLQVWSLVTSQTALMGLAAAALAVPLGSAMAWAMVNVINRRAFGWSFELRLAGAPFAQALAVGVGAALLAGVYPALRMARMRPARVLKDE